MPALSLAQQEGGPLYQRVATRIEGLIATGTLRPGERIPSVRKLSRQLSVSVSTVLEAYRLLEDRRLVEARPQSGYYVRARLEGLPLPAKTQCERTAVAPNIGELALRMIRQASDPSIVPMGAAIPSPEFFPTARLNRILARVVREDPEASQSYDMLPGYEGLRIQIARRALEAGCTLSPDDIVITSGAQEAVHLALRAVTKPGDTVAVETPTYYGLLEAIESLHLKALEISTDPSEGICLEALGNALDHQGVTAVALVPTFGNPLGHCMSDEKKQLLVEMLARRDIPLVEDDVYGELSYNYPRPAAAKAFDTSSTVLLCSSFSKTLAPGYRIGWVAAGSQLERVERLKFSASVATATPTQMAVSAFLESGGFDRYLRRLRRQYRELTEHVSAVIGERFPEGAKVTRPAGGHLLWVELPEGVDALRLHEEALAHGLSIAPGPLFSATKRYGNFIRLNCAIPWSNRVERALETLGELVAAQIS